MGEIAKTNIVNTAGIYMKKKNKNMFYDLLMRSVFLILLLFNIRKIPYKIIVTVFN